MTPEERDQIRIRIEEEKEKALQAVAAQGQDNRSIAPDRAIGRISRMDAMYGQQVNDATLQRTKDRLARLDYLLAHIGSPDFGLCECCRAPIPPARLKAMPESTTCMRCAAFAR